MVYGRRMTKGESPTIAVGEKQMNTAKVVYLVCKGSGTTYAHVCTLYIFMTFAT